MIHRARQRKFSRTKNARNALLKSLAGSLILHERIVTTEAKAKAIRPVVEKLVTRSKEGTIANRRILVSKVGRENVVSKLIDLVGPTFKDRPGGYTRIVKLEQRPGDRARMAMIEFVENISERAAKENLEKKTKVKKIETQKTQSKKVPVTKTRPKKRSKEVLGGDSAKTAATSKISDKTTSKRAKKSVPAEKKQK